MILALLLLCGATAYSDFFIDELWEEDKFYDQFTFFTDNDPTNGYVDFLSRKEAQARGLISAGANQPVYMGSDHTNIARGRGRAAIRIVSNESWTVSPTSQHEWLFVIDLLHMPTGCGTWPAWWFVGPNWPNDGEIDVIEGVNLLQTDTTSLHTSYDCTMNPHQGGFGPGQWKNLNCTSGPAGNIGCNIGGPTNSYGMPFNKAGGGLYAMLWGRDAISVWFFERGHIPSDLQLPARISAPDRWGLPTAKFNFGGDCPSSHFQKLQMVFDLTFCGDWAGAAFGQDCPGKGQCNDFVRKNPHAFKEAYWSINFVKTMRSGPH